MFLVSINAPILSKDTYLCSALYIVAAFLEVSKSALFGFHLKHVTFSFGYNSFIASKLDSVPFNFRDALASVLFFLTILNNLSSPALLCGKTRTTSTTLMRFRNPGEPR